MRGCKTFGKDLGQNTASLSHKLWVHPLPRNLISPCQTLDHGCSVLTHMTPIESQIGKASRELMIMIAIKTAMLLKLFWFLILRTSNSLFATQSHIETGKNYHIYQVYITFQKEKDYKFLMCVRKWWEILVPPQNCTYNLVPSIEVKIDEKS